MLEGDQRRVRMVDQEHEVEKEGDGQSVGPERGQEVQRMIAIGGDFPHRYYSRKNVRIQSKSVAMKAEKGLRPCSSTQRI